jgi:hypothetical protein
VEGSGGATELRVPIGSVEPSPTRSRHIDRSLD